MRPLGIGTTLPRAPSPFTDAPVVSPTAASGTDDAARPAQPTTPSTGGRGTTATLHGEFGATSALNRAMNSNGVVIRCVAPALRGDFTR